MNAIVKFMIALALICLAGYGLWHAIKGSIAKRPDRNQATIVYAIWLVLMIVGMVAIHPAMVLLPLVVLAPMSFAGGIFSGLIPKPQPGEGGIKLLVEDVFDMGINALFTGIFLIIVIAVAYGISSANFG